MQVISVRETECEYTAEFQSRQPTGLTLGSSDAEALSPLLLCNPEAVAICDCDGRILVVNRPLCHLFGYGDQDLIGQPIEILLPIRARGLHPAQRAAYLADPTLRPMGQGRDVRGLRRDGREISVEIRLCLIQADSGLLTVASIRDVGEVRLLSSIQQNSNRILQMIAVGHPLREVLSQVAASIEPANPAAACSILRLDHDQRRTWSCTAPFLSAAYCRAVDEMLAEYESTSAEIAPSLNERVVIADAREKLFWRNLASLTKRHGFHAGWAEPIRDTNGNVLGALVVNYVQPQRPDTREIEFGAAAGQLAGIAIERDIRSQQLTEKVEQLRQAQKLEAVGTLAGGIAHEFNNLLQVILGFTACAAEGLAMDDQRFHDLEQVRVASDHARSLTRQLLTYSRQQQPRLSTTDANAVVASVSRMLRPLIGERIRLTLACDKMLQPVLADAQQLQQVLINLCLNARDALPEGGEIHIATAFELADGNVADSLGVASGSPITTIVVSDTGCGMSDEVQARVFEPFFTTKEIGKGSGLGLAVAYGIVKEHRGTISVRSAPGCGTVFRLCFPASLPTPELPASIAGDMTFGTKGNESILVAEDEPLVRRLIVRVLSGAGYKVYSAENGREAIRRFHALEEPIHLAMLDASMPESDGHRVAAAIRQSQADLPIILLTGYDPVDATDVRITKTLTKPVDPETLLNAVRSCLDESRYKAK